MQDSHAIGTLAEKILAVSIHRTGRIVPIARRRGRDGQLTNVLQHVVDPELSSSTRDFVVRVHRGSTGVVAVGPRSWIGEYCVGVIPLGSSQPFGASGPRPLRPADAHLDQDTTASNPDEVWFRYENGNLSWRTGAVSGEAVVNEKYPELGITLRLPPGNHGEISFAAPLFTTTAGEHTSVLSVA